MRAGQGTPDSHKPGKNGDGGPGNTSLSAPVISLPKGGGAIRGIGEKFAANPVTGTGSMAVPIATSPGRSGFGPQLSLTYDSGAGNGPFGFGWSLSLPSITRKTDKGLPQYGDAEDSDVFILSGAEDLVPVYRQDHDGSWVASHVASHPGYQRDPEGFWVRDQDGHLVMHEDEFDGYRVRRYRPRIEGLFARIERWTKVDKPDDVHWRSISKDNILTLYGLDVESRIADPLDASHIFSWLICETRDDKGNAVLYRYKAEDGLGVDLGKVHERNRWLQYDVRHPMNRYLKRIHYGNRTPLLDNTGRRPRFLDKAQIDAQISNADWMFEVVFDYDDHDPADPKPGDDQAKDETGVLKYPWKPRQDPFSTYRAGFEVRAYRVCQRVLMFHHFAGDEDVGEDCLVRSTDFTYSQDQEPTSARNPVYTFLLAVTQSGYKRDNDRYLKRSLPPVEFAYSEPIVQDSVHEVDAESLENLPVGLDGAAYQWTDLHGEGIPGLLTEQGGAWFYKRNLSPRDVKYVNGVPHTKATFAPVELVAKKPNLTLGGGQGQFMDLAGDGQPDLVVLDGPVPGLYEHDGAEGWQPFRPFTARLNRDMRDPNLKFVDLDGDGHADVLITEENALVWHASLGERGFGPARRVHQALDEEKGPRLVFADGEQSIYLADLSGDGLTDLVRLRNGEVCYWPNLGYGRFGTKVTMDHAPHFDHPDQFDQQRIRLADIDGTGTTDIIYLHRDGVRLYFNQSGNSWSAPQVLHAFPRVDDLAGIVPTDLLGNGTACLVWSSPLPGDEGQHMRYVDLMGSQKPHLLVSVRNNLGVETRVQYAPSTKFYLQDKHDGKPWITRLPFPVHVVESTTVTDKWRGMTFTSSYSYHHGYFDGDEREFRGFGRVEHVDVEDFGLFAEGNAGSPYITDDKRLYQPPVKTVTWFHTGAFLDRERILSQFQDEYFPHWFEALRPGQQALGSFREHHLPEPDLAAQVLTAEEWHEALRACKGMTLRQETYELDVDALARGDQRPVKLFLASYHNCHIQRLQPRAGQKHAVFHVTESEAITYHYELDLRQAELTPDPRIAHTLTLSVDEFGNVRQAATVGYPRWQAASLNDPQLTGNGVERLVQKVQAELHLAYAETRYTNDVVDEPNDYRLRLPCEVLTYELTGIGPQDSGGEATDDAGVGARYFTLDELRAFKLSDFYQTAGQAVQEIAYHVLPHHDTPQKRLVEHTCILFFIPDLTAPFALGTLDARALPYETYTLALTDGLLNTILASKLTDNVKTALANQQTSGYLSGAELASRFPGGDDGQYWMCSGVAGFNADAAQRFFLPDRYIDPFGNVTTLQYNLPDLLFIQSSTDPLDNTTRVTRFDFRVLAPCQIQDPNNNKSAVAFDILGMPTAMAVMGKGDEGDALPRDDDPSLNPTPGEMAAFFVTDEYSQARAQAWLGTASARHLYSFGERVETDQVVWEGHPACACGIVREQHAVQPLNSAVQTAFEYSDGGGNVLVTKVQAEPAQPGGPLQWVASGKTVLNNKGKPVKQYEPYFSQPEDAHRFEESVKMGVTPLMYYDAVGRLIRTEAPDGSFSRVEFSPWHVRTFDQNDTVMEPGNVWFARKTAATATAADQRAARLAAEHADTPALTLLDSLGREVVSVAHNRVKRDGGLTDEKYVTFSKLDAEGKPLWIQDARGNRVMQYVTPPLSGGAHPFDDAQNLEPQGTVPCYDMAGNLLFQYSMDAGERWMLNDAAGKPMLAWNSRGFITRATYDALRRLTGSFITAAGAFTLTGAPRDPALPSEDEVQYEQLEYGEGRQINTERNLRGKLFQHSNAAGAVTTVRYDFKGNPLHVQRRLTADYKSIPHQSQNPAREDEWFDSGMHYDALNRPTQIVVVHNAPASPQRVYVTQPSYNEAGLLERVDVWLNRNAVPSRLLNPGTADQHAVKNISYNAKGQRELIEYSNGATTTYDYDEQTFRLTRLTTTRPSNADATASQLFKRATVVQDLGYTYDPVGNITRIADAALNMINGEPNEAACDYTYDALYRLAAASGREHGGQAAFDFNPSDRNFRDYPFAGQRVHANDLQGLRGYVETYRTDTVGNIMHMKHHAGSNIDQPGLVLWKRGYQYALDSNRLLATSTPGDRDDVPDYVAGPVDYTHTYSYDAHGNMTSMPHLPLMQWDFNDQLSATSGQVANNGTPETTYYTYDATGQRVRKVTERYAPNGEEPGRKDERIYLGGFEVYREYENDGDTVKLERETLHIMDDEQRIALVETRIQGNDPAPAQSIRYQFGNHLGSVSLELDDQAQIISYEEYTPYGSTSFQAGHSQTEVPKRYRYTGMERDEESGFYYHGARYYAPWLGRWASCDRNGTVDGPNLYSYVGGNPQMFTDPTGMQREPSRSEIIKNALLCMTEAGFLGWAKKNGISSWEINFPDVPHAKLMAEKMQLDADLPQFTTVQGPIRLNRTFDESGREVPRGSLGPLAYSISPDEELLLHQWEGLGVRSSDPITGIYYAISGEDIATANFAGGLVMAAGGTASARNTNNAITSSLPSRDRVTVSSPGPNPAPAAAPPNRTPANPAEPSILSKPPKVVSAPASPNPPPPLTPGQSTDGGTTGVVPPSPPSGYLIGQGVHRARAAVALGIPSLKAELYRGDKLIGTIDVNVAELRSPKATIKGSDRYKDALEDVSKGKYYPIQIRELPGGTPIHQVRIIKPRD
jgi:RHS repeat-associated protein